MNDEQSMVERVARACWQTQTIRAWEDAHETEREEMVGYARAAIEAMRTPNHEMRLAAWKLLDDNAKSGNLQAGRIPGNGMPDAILSVMIDAALNEHANAR